MKEYDFKRKGKDTLSCVCCDRSVFVVNAPALFYQLHSKMDEASFEDTSNFELKI